MVVAQPVGKQVGHLCDWMNQENDSRTLVPARRHKPLDDAREINQKVGATVPVPLMTTMLFAYRVVMAA